MKEASGELSLTLITIVAIAIVAALATWLVPQIREAVEAKWGETQSTLEGMS